MKNYTLILGESPSKGARSPLLWNKTYSELKIDQKMYPRDIALKNFGDEIPKIFDDKYFIGGAVAVPYKEKIIDFTDNRDEIISVLKQSIVQLEKMVNLMDITPMELPLIKF